MKLRLYYGATADVGVWPGGICRYVLGAEEELEKKRTYIVRREVSQWVMKFGFICFCSQLGETSSESCIVALDI